MPLDDEDLSYLPVVSCLPVLLLNFENQCQVTYTHVQRERERERKRERERERYRRGGGGAGTVSYKKRPVANAK